MLQREDVKRITEEILRDLTLDATMSAGTICIKILHSGTEIHRTYVDIDLPVNYDNIQTLR